MFAAALLILSASLSDAQGTETFRGVLEPNLTPGPGLVVTLGRWAEPAVDVPIPDGAAVFAGSLLPMGQWEFRVLLVEPRSGSPFMFIDTDRNGAFDAGERFAFSATRHQFGSRRIRVPLPPAAGSLFGHIPIELLLADGRLPAHGRADQRYLLHSGHYATAKVRIDGRAYFFRYAVQPDTGTIDLSHGYQLVDEGRLPDFSFYDSRQRTYHLTDFRGRFVLINVWCGPCEDQFTYLRAAAARCGHTDLTILGFSQGYPREGHLWDISPTSPPEWIEAEPQSVRRLLDDWFQITSTPTLILLDRDGRIAVLERRADGERPLSGDELLHTLERFIGGLPRR